MRAAQQELWPSVEGCSRSTVIWQERRREIKSLTLFFSCRPPSFPLAKSKVRGLGAVLCRFFRTTGSRIGHPKRGSVDLEQQIEDMQHNYPPSRLQAGEVPKSLSLHGELAHVYLHHTWPHRLLIQWHEEKVLFFILWGDCVIENIMAILQSLVVWLLSSP